VTRRHLGALLLAALLGACTVGPNYVPPHPKLPQNWTEQPATPGEEATAAEQLKSWWTQFHDPELNRLVGEAIGGNLTLQMARQRLIEARAERTVAAAAAYPQVGFGAAASDANSSTTVIWPPGNGIYPTYQIGFDASWELDIFGGTRRAVQAADATIGATIEDRRAILVSLLAELADDYATLRATQLRISIAQGNEVLAQHLLDLTTTEFTRGLAGDLAVSQARAELETVQSALPALQAQEARLTHAIAVLLGTFPGGMEQELSRPAPTMPTTPNLPLSLPSEVVANRPDIRETERRFAAATARIGVAVAQLYPHFTIPLTMTPTSSYIHEMFSAASLVWSAGLTLAQPIYQGGRLSGQVKEARAAAMSDRLAYQQTVLTSFREVEDALVSYSSETQRDQKLSAAVADSRIAVDRAQRLYAAGLTDFLNLLTTERGLYAAEDQAALSDLARVQQLIALYKSLGGGWQSVSFNDDQA
jgi:NodT family efflux transporter outer membrane factor (OMF) lipoprotein